MATKSRQRLPLRMHVKIMNRGVENMMVKDGNIECGKDVLIHLLHGGEKYLSTQSLDYTQNGQNVQGKAAFNC